MWILFVLKYTHIHTHAHTCEGTALLGYTRRYLQGGFIFSAFILSYNFCVSYLSLFLL